MPAVTLPALLVMTIPTDDMTDRLPYMLVGAAAGLAVATVVPAGILLAVGTIAVGGTIAFRTWKKRKTKEPEIVDVETKETH